ncbi:hypothetical protein Tco_1122923, partial [Tanacetum coccineum]
QMTDTYFVEYTGLEVQHFRDTLLQHLGNVKKSVAERTRHQRQYERRVNKRQMQTQESKIDTGKALDADLVDTESIRTDSTVQDDSSRSGNDTDADDADIRPIYDEEPMAEVQLTAECNIFAIGQQHTEQPEIIVEGRVDQYPETCQVKSPMLDSSPDNQTTEYSKQSLESENILLKETVAQFQKDFSRMEAHCIALELKYQNQSLKSGQHGQILNETSNKAKIEKEIDVLETMNIELEHSVATLRKENETLKQHYKDLYDSIKITRSKTTEQTTSLLANNAELKAQIQEKVFAIAALKNDLRKLKGNSVDTKFDKTSVLGKPVLPSLRNQSVVRQPNAFKSERAQMSKQRFASQVDVNKNLSKPVTQHYLPKKTESAFAKPDHVIASSSSRNSSKNMPRFSSNDMVHNHYLDEARKKTQERDRNSKTSVMPSARFQSTADGSKPKPRSNNQTSRSLPVSKSTRVTITAVPKADHSKSSSSFSDSKQFVCSTCHKCVFNANHDACITKLLKEVNSRAKVPSNKTTNRNKPVEQIRIAKKPERQIPTGHRFSIKKTSAVHEKTMTLRSCLRWKPTGKIFKTVGLRWVPTGKIFTSSTTKVDSEPQNGSNADITNQYESAQTLDVSAGTSNLSAAMTSVHNSSGLAPPRQMTSDHNSSELEIHDHSNELSSSKLVPKVVPPADKTATSRQELELLFHHHITMLRSYVLSWKPCQGDSLNLPDHGYSNYTIKRETKGLDDDVAASFQRRAPGGKEIRAVGVGVGLGQGWSGERGGWGWLCGRARGGGGLFTAVQQWSYALSMRFCQYIRVDNYVLNMVDWKSGLSHIKQSSLVGDSFFIVPDVQILLLLPESQDYLKDGHGDAHYSSWKSDSLPHDHA